MAALMDNNKKNLVCTPYRVANTLAFSINRQYIASQYVSNTFWEAYKGRTLRTMWDVFGPKRDEQMEIGENDIIWNFIISMGIRIL